MLSNPPEDPSLIPEIQELLQAVGGFEELRRSPENIEEFFERIYPIYEPPIRGYLAKLVGDEKIAEELSQEAFLSIWRSFQNLRSLSGFRIFLYKTARSRAMDRFRRRSVKADKMTVSLSWPEKPEHVYIAEELSIAGPEEQVLRAEEVRRILNQLPLDEKDCLLLFYNEGYSQKEIARMCKISEREVRRRLKAAKAKFSNKYRG